MKWIMLKHANFNKKICSGGEKPTFQAVSLRALLAAFQAYKISLESNMKS